MDLELIHNFLKRSYWASGTPAEVVERSAATFHWVRDHPLLFRHLYDILKPGGWLHAQCGGWGNCSRTPSGQQLVGTSKTGSPTSKPLRPAAGIFHGNLLFYEVGRIGGGTVKVGSIVVRCYEFDKMLAFWREALHYVPREPPEDG